MNWTPESLARAFHEAYGRVSPKFFGTTGNAPAWESIPEKSKQHMIAVCADVLGQAIEIEPPAQASEPVPTKKEFVEAREAAPDENALENWEDDLRRQIDGAVKRAKYARPEFDNVVR